MPIGMASKQPQLVSIWIRAHANHCLRSIHRLRFYWQNVRNTSSSVWWRMSSSLLVLLLLLKVLFFASSPVLWTKKRKNEKEYEKLVWNEIVEETSSRYYSVYASFPISAISCNYLLSSHSFPICTHTHTYGAQRTHMPEHTCTVVRCGFDFNFRSSYKYASIHSWR